MLAENLDDLRSPTAETIVITKKLELSNIPKELLTQILSWLPPPNAVKLRRISTAFNSNISTCSFAFMNLSRFIAPKTQIPPTLSPLSTRTSSKSTWWRPSRFDILFFTAPEPYKIVFAQRFASHIACMEWVMTRERPTKLKIQIPPSIGLMTSLVRLTARNCLLQGPLPAEIGNLRNLQELSLFGNFLTGEIPVELGNLKQLRHLNLEQNEFSASMRFIGDSFLCFAPTVTTEEGLGDSWINNLKFLSVAHNKLTKAVPPEIGRLQALTILDLSCNDFTSLPVEIWSLTNLEVLCLSRNRRLTGVLPPEIGNMANLVALNASQCNFTGGIPPEVGGLMNLQSLVLEGNQLMGELPVEMLNMVRLEECWLENNRGLVLSFQFPAEVVVHL